MSDRFLEILKDKRLSMNYIPSGRQLPRTPPLTDVKKHLHFSNDESNVDCEELQQNMEADSRDQDANDENTVFDFNTAGTKPDEPNSMLKGMKGYQLTPTDLEFIEKMKAEKHVKKLQGDLEEVQKLLKSELMLLELACASIEKAQDKLENLPSCEDLTEWVTVVLKMTSPSTDLTGLDAKSLLAKVRKEDVERAVVEKRIELARMKKMAANKRKKEAKERGQLEKQIASEQLKIHGLMIQLSDLKSELAQQKEAYEALEMQISTQEASEITAEEVDTPKELQTPKTQAKRRGKGRTKAAEKVQDTTNQSKSTRSKPTGSQTGKKEDRANKKASEAPETKQKSRAAAEKPIKSIKEEEKKVEESRSQEPVQGLRGRKKHPGAKQPKNHSGVKAVEALSTSQSRKEATVAAGDAGEEAQNTVLRRSKRIASRT